MMITRPFLLVSALLFGSVAAWAPSSARGFAPRQTMALHAIDYNDPVVAEEFAAVQPMAFEDVEEELQTSGIRVPPTMNDMEAKLILVEMRLRLNGKLGGNDTKKRPAKFSSKFEEAIWTKPAFDEFYCALKKDGDPNALNVITEYLNNPDIAKQRYGQDYKPLIRKIEAALTAPPPVKTPKLKFSGFPANMGADACRMTLESIGPLVEFDCQESDDLPILSGVVSFENIESAKKAVEQYNGMDMGMGNILELRSV